jgi:hypothetical protein
MTVTVKLSMLLLLLFLVLTSRGLVSRYQSFGDVFISLDYILRRFLSNLRLYSVELNDM